MPAFVGVKVTCSTTCCPGCNVSGKLAPPTLKPLPLTDAALTCTAAVPVDTSVTLCDPLLPTVTFPKFTLVVLSRNAGDVCVTPAPLKATCCVAPVDELLLIANAPVAVPAFVGVKVTCSTTCCPGCNVSGKLAPLTLKPLPLTDAALTCTAVVPIELNVTFCVPLLPTVTLPKLTLDGLTANVATT